ncbi:lipopolysaccharide kinase InaA family protein, partial [Stenotrophomonas maltophilia]|uniref:lipopolysaccharide kinase InaA family protein n=1 Tax=Stenotrophomonas maltophilia TaxID=40324 RepID=UPI001953DCFA
RMSDFIASEERALLERHGLATFDALWNLQLDAVDEPNTGRGGWSSVYRLDLEGRGFYLKRQSNYLTRTLARPF